MSNSTNLTDEYPRMLNWFIENKEINPHILKSGQRKDGKWWFTFAKNNLSVEEYRKKLSKLISIGFSIPDYEKEDKFLQLVTEPFAKINTGLVKVFTCSNCNHVIDLRSDLDKYSTMRSFHKKIFTEASADE